MLLSYLKSLKDGWGKTVMTVLFFAFLLNLGVSAAHQMMLQRGIAEEVLRFHVLANSDSDEDQRVKYAVRDEVLTWMRNNTEWETQIKTAAHQTEHVSEKKEVEAFLSAHLPELEQVADRVLKEQGMTYRAKASLETVYFPKRTYGDCTFPSGWYEALRIQLGDAKGRNWWCVLYPQLCFSDCLHAVVGDDEKEDLKKVLSAEEYESLLREPGKWKISFRWF